MNTDNKLNYWDYHQKQWNALGSPLRPAPEDLQIFNSGVSEWSAANAGRPAAAFVLGSTPEFPSLDWPEGSRVYALDSSINMIKYIWPATARFATGRVVMNWLAVPLADETADIIIGDGCFTLIGWPDAYRKLLESIALLLKQDGRLLMRFFVRPQKAELPEQVFDDLAAGNIGSFHSFKWRLAMAMHGENPQGICVNEIWNVWNKSGLTIEGVALDHGWPYEVVQTINAYRNSTQRLSFPAVNQLKQLLSEYFSEVSCHYPCYELGGCSPILALKRIK